MISKNDAPPQLKRQEFLIPERCQTLEMLEWYDFHRFPTWVRMKKKNSSSEIRQSLLILLRKEEYVTSKTS